MIVKKLKEFVAKNQQQLTTNVKNKISVGFKKRTICIPCDNLGSSDYHLEHHSVPNGIVEMRYGTRIIATSKDFFLQRKI